MQLLLSLFLFLSLFLSFSVLLFFFYFMSFLWSLTFIFYLLLFSHSLLGVVLPLCLILFIPFFLFSLPSSHPTFFLSPTPFSQTTTTTHHGSQKTVSSSLPFLQELSSIPTTQMTLHPLSVSPASTSLPPSHLLCLQVSLYPRLQLLNPNVPTGYAQTFRAHWEPPLSTSLPFSGSPPISPESHHGP